MPNTGVPTDGHSSDLATNRTGFPSREIWERWWEKVIDLEWPRANRDGAERIARLIERRPDGRSDLKPDRISLRLLVEAVQLDEATAAQLLRDVMAIEAWYHIPQRRLRLGLENSGEALEKAAALARDLHIMLDANAVALEAASDRG